MKIDVVGCMCTWTKKLSTSFIINDEMLFDAPQSSFKTLFTDYDLTKIKYIIISHFHSDHFGDLHLVMDYIYHHANHKIKIIAPAGCKERLKSIFKVFEISYLEQALEEQFEFVDCTNGKIVKFDGYKIKIFKMLHQNLDSYGFIIEKDGIAIGFSGDSAMCNNLHKIICKTKAAFVDCSAISVNNKHLSVEEFFSLKKSYPLCQMIPVHMSIYSEKELLSNNISVPFQGKIIEIV